MSALVQMMAWHRTDQSLFDRMMTQHTDAYLPACRQRNLQIICQTSGTIGCQGICRHNYGVSLLTHWGRVTHLCISELSIIGSDNGLSPGRRQVIIWTNAGILLVGPLRTNFSEILVKIHTFSFSKIHLKMSSVKWRPFCPGLNVLSADIKQCLVPGHLQPATMTINTLRPTQNGCQFPDDISKCIFLNKNIWILLKISLKLI